ncbi:MAG TPA: N-methyl-L-tryptophan oxidase [Chthoniobacterales bacterium]|nr:N-methyl-L-tryptophan oxidase [Chthoniobacterales bacterium]
MGYDVAVVGLGGMGSAILAHCAARGAAAIGIEQFQPAHDLGSSHGKSRMIRKAYFEDPAYVPLVLRAYELWRELERETSEEILRLTGVLSIGQETSEIVQGTRRAAAEHDLALESLSQREVKARYPTLELGSNEVALLEPDGGVLDPERAVRAHLNLAKSRGAAMRFGVAVESWHAKDKGFDVRLSDDTQISATKLVLALGPWFKETLESLGIRLRVQRNIQAWFSPATNAYDWPGFPAFLVDRQDLPAPLYGFPDFGDGVKAAFHGFGDLTDAEHINREIDPARDVEPIARALEQWMPAAAGVLREAKPCMYSLTPDANFVIDRHPEHANLILCGGFSGHGFKFAPVVGEIAAELALDGGSRHRIEFLSLQRFR